MLVSHLLALDHVESEVGPVSFADPVRIGFDVTPAEAIKYFRNKKIVKRKEFDQLAEDARAAAFTVAGVYKNDVIEAFKDEITKALETGASQQQVIKRFRDILDGAGHRQLGAFHLETVFRTNMQMAYGVGRRRGLEAIADDLPYWQYHAVMDDRVRPSHAALNGLILLANHEFWRDHYPPWSFNCRCTVTATDEIPQGYNHSNPSGEAELFYDEKGNPAKAETGTMVIDLAAEGNFQGVPPQGTLKSVIEAGAKRAAGATPKQASAPVSQALGTPVSRALDATGTKKFKEQVRRVSELIDQVHGDGQLPTIPINSSAARSSLGSYHSRGGQAVKINISKHGDHSEMTAFHEIGHFLDHQGVGTGKFASIADARLKAWRNAISNSRAAKELEELSKNPKVQVDVGGQKIEYYVDRRYVRYLQTWEEFWARSYAQYIARKTGDPTALSQLNKMRDRKPRMLYYPNQWDDDDFEPIAEAIEELLRSLGWMK